MASDQQQLDQYGQVHPIETPSLITTKLKDFESAVQNIPTNEKESLVDAEAQCPELLTEDFKLQFLRCEVFNEKLAAKRYAKYWTKRVEIFGELAFQALTLNKALQEDSVALKLGFFRLTGTHDPSGRSIVFADPSKQDRKKATNESMGRAVWYAFHAAQEKEETQKKGVVIIVYAANAKEFNRGLAKLVTSSIKGCLPIRLSALHVCHPPTFFRIVFPIITIFMGERVRKRIRVHAGSEEHVLEELATYGLTKDLVPSDLGGDVVLDHESWLEQRKSAGK